MGNSVGNITNFNGKNVKVGDASWMDKFNWLKGGPKIEGTTSEAYLDTLDDMGLAGSSYNFGNNFNYAGGMTPAMQADLLDPEFGVQAQQGYNGNSSSAGTSTGTDWGGVLGNVGTGVNILSGLAGMYFANKNYKLQKDAQEQEERIQNRQLAKQDKMQANYDATV